MMTVPDVERLAAWFSTELSDAGGVQVERVERPASGNSSDSLLVTLVRKAAGGHQRRQVVIRLRPPPPGLLEPYDMGKQFEILRRLESTDVRAPRVLCIESSGTVLGREFYVMDRMPGTVYELSIPDEIQSDPQRARRMCESMIEQLATIHNVDIHATGLDTVAEGRGHVDREIAHWTSEVARVQRGPLPALEAQASALRERQPPPSGRIVLVHGDVKPGNIAFVGTEVSAVFDWEMATIGDPLTDIGYAENTWTARRALAAVPGAPSTDELVARYEELTGIAVEHREWYRALARFKLSVILLVGSALVNEGHSDDATLAAAAHLIHPMTQAGLRELECDDDVEPGPVLPDPTRVPAISAGAAQSGKANGPLGPEPIGPRADQGRS